MTKLMQPHFSTYPAKFDIPALSTIKQTAYRQETMLTLPLGGCCREE